MKQIRFSMIAMVLALFAIASVASAQHVSTPDGWNAAVMDVEVQGTVANQASFEVASGTFVIDTFHIAPGQNFNVSLRVWNTTGDRAIRVVDMPSILGNTAGLFSIAAVTGEVTIPAGAFRDITWNMTIDSNLNPSYLGQTMSVTFSLRGEGVGPVAQNVNLR